VDNEHFAVGCRDAARVQAAVASVRGVCMESVNRVGVVASGVGTQIDREFEK